MAKLKDERRQPIPPGRYFMNVIGAENIKDFARDVKEQEGAIVVESSELDNTETPLENVLTNGVNPSSLFVIFKVPEGRAPFLNQQKYGFPTIAPVNVKTRDDTEKFPPVEPPDARDAVKVLLVIAGVLGVVGVIGVIIAVHSAKKVSELERLAPLLG